ncbi:MAG: hypothetical protein H5T62_14245 [Anaerolineae bacterium]|nr:hypothetical protein [Anaerolineae bacterium]
MSSSALKDLAQQLEQLDAEDKLALLALLAESLRRQIRPERRPLSAYYGLGAGQGFKTAVDVDTFIQEERASWER